MTATAYTLSTTGVTNAGESLTKERVEFCVILPAGTKATDTLTIPVLSGQTARIISVVDSRFGTYATATVSGPTIVLGANAGAEGGSQVPLVKWIYVDE